MIEYIKTRFRDHHKLLISVSLLFTISLFILIAEFLLSYYQYTINKTVDKKEANRTLIIYNVTKEMTNQDFIELSKIKHVINIYEEYTNWNLKEKDKIFLPQNNSNITNTKINIGHNINSPNEVLINKTAANEYHLSIDDQINLNDKYKVKIVGIINNDEIPSIYFENKALRNIALQEQAFLSKMNIVIDEYQNLNFVIKELQNRGYEAIKNETLDQEVNRLEEIINNISFGIYFIIMFTIVITFSIFNILVKNEIKNNALLKLIGYKNKNIVFMNFIYLLIIIIISLLSNSVIYFFLKLILDINNCFTIPYIDYLSIISYIFLLYFIILVIISLINYLKLHKIDMLNIIEES